MRTVDFNYNLPPELIAQKPIEPRDISRLLVVNRQSGAVEHHHFNEVPDFLRSGDVMIFNDSRVIPARLSGTKTNTKGQVEILLLRRLSPNVWETLVKPGRRVRTGAALELADGQGSSIVAAEVIEERENGIRIIRFSDESLLSDLGTVALPPYIHEPLQNPERYQTVYADQKGSVAAPTAGLHFTPGLLTRIREKGVKCLFVTLHVGLDTFRLVQEDNPQEHRIHREYGFVSEDVAGELTRAKKEGRRIICVGTTSVRLIEAVAQTGSNDLF
ncbi:MAG: tRNA preQ1(34) S-adenosylmethionine ribosyltransferase-isomerase QueA, partial [Dehalococcoidales bacterium]|nr:tRNA preQ1(34) S-adenosylmethionine ribosyltransferase-isomerase QueA [Dehalococcoidales bacterium]